MKLFTNVAIVTDQTMDEDADAIRGVLESFRLRVDFYRLVQKPQVTNFFQQDRQYPYTILFSHGAGDPPDELHLAIQVVDQKDGRYEEPQDGEHFARWRKSALRHQMATRGVGVKILGLTITCSEHRHPPKKDLCHVPEDAKRSRAPTARKSSGF